MRFVLEHTDATTGARAGRIETDHGAIETPIFMPVGTVGSVKGIEPRDLEDEIGADIILGNTYHLYLRPGTELLEQAGGLHRFMSWDGPILTDSGGFQVFSLKGLRTLDDDSVTFKSHVDGSKHTFTPENVIDTQRSIGSDIMMVLDECAPGDSDRNTARRANARTLAWAERCRARWAETEDRYGHSQALFAIGQGVVYPDLRRDCARALVDMDFPGYAIGGLSVGESAEAMYDMVEVSCEVLPPEKPRYLMGVGTPANLLENVARGIDMFDCVMPTRNGRNGTVFTTEGIMNLRNRKWRDDFTAFDPGLPHPTAQNYSRAYLRHLIVTKEMLGARLATLHNLNFYLWLMREARAAILEDRYAEFVRAWVPRVSARR